MSRFQWTARDSDLDERTRALSFDRRKWLSREDNLRLFYLKEMVFTGSIVEIFLFCSNIFFFLLRK